jgi:hypothetical protein
MTDLSVTTIINSIVNLLTEAYAGPPDPSSTWFIDNEPDSGILGIIANVSAAEASRSVDSSETFEGKWKESWQLLVVEDASWDALRDELRTEFETLCQGLQAQTNLPEQYLTGTLALLPHAAYHLGTIRQMIERVRA